MPVLRSRVIPAAVKESPKDARNEEESPSTPAKDLEGFNPPKAASCSVTQNPNPPKTNAGSGSGNGNASRRRSLRLASKVQALEENLVCTDETNLGTSVADTVEDRVNANIGDSEGMSKVGVELDTTMVKSDGLGNLDGGVGSVNRKRKVSLKDKMFVSPEVKVGDTNLDGGVGSVNWKRKFSVKDKLSQEEARNFEGTGKVEVEHDTITVKLDGLRISDGGAGSVSRKRKSCNKDKSSVSQDQVHKALRLRSGKVIVESEVNPVAGSQEVGSIGGTLLFSGIASKGITGENGGGVSDSKDNAVVVDYNSTQGKELSEKGKAKLVEKYSYTNASGSSTYLDQLRSEAEVADGNSSVGIDTKRNDKGKEKVVDSGLTPRSTDAVNYNSTNDVERGDESIFDSSSDEDIPQNVERMNIGVNPRQRFREVAKRNARRFAYFSAEDGEINDSIYETPHGDNPINPSSDPNKEAEDWPGPFSTAMKIITDRKNHSLQQKKTSMDKVGAALVSWVPRKDRKDSFSKKSVPSLQDMCLKTLAKHADAITSLDCVPDLLRHKLSQLLSDSRGMNSHFLSLLLQGSPTEIRIRDCSWLSEEIFTEKFGGCDTSNLMVLQLDQCGRCLADYILVATLARSANSLPSLTTISFRAAYRLSDVGLSAIVSSAPSLRSVDLRQCSLITSDGICCLAASLGSVLRELYLDDCEGIDAMLILPALVNLENLEVLSLSGLETVCDEFISEFVGARGHRIKELILADCTRLTNTSVKLITETCHELCAVDLSNLCNLTDSALGYLSNGCRVLQTLKMRRNSFSDEAVAAYLETRGDSLRELSLSHVEQVAQCTAMSLSKCSVTLNYLDVSWCRNLSDEALGLIVDGCTSLKVLKVFGCTQITDVFLLGHSNEEVEIVGLKMKPLLDHLRVDNISDGPLRYSSANI